MRLTKGRLGPSKRCTYSISHIAPSCLSQSSYWQIYSGAVAHGRSTQRVCFRSSLLDPCPSGLACSCIRSLGHVDSDVSLCTPQSLLESLRSPRLAIAATSAQASKSFSYARGGAVKPAASRIQRFALDSCRGGETRAACPRPSFLKGILLPH